MKRLLLALLAVEALLLSRPASNHAVVKNESASGRLPARGVRPDGSPPGQQPGPPGFKEGELLVKYRVGAEDFSSSAARARRMSLHGRHGSQSLAEYRLSRTEHLRLAEGVSVEAAIERYQQDPLVEYAEPNFIVSAQALPDDPLFTAQWSLSNTGQTGGAPGAHLDMPGAWDIATGDAAVVVAVIDSGIDYGHPDLSANVWVNTEEIAGDGVDNDANGYVDDIHGIDVSNRDSDPMDDNGHGTHVAGIIGAQGNNGLGIAGVTWRARILACKFLDVNGSGLVSGAIRSLEYVRLLKDRGVDILATNNSWVATSYSQALADAISAQRDILLVAAAGNEGADNGLSGIYPASYKLPNVISVSATDHSDTRPPWSNYGRTSVLIGAPGAEIVSLRAAGTDLYRDGLHFIPDGDPGALYYRASGTSMAAPHVTGLAALIKSWDPGLDYSGIRNLIISGADPVLSLDSRTITGRRINAHGSLDCADRPVLALLDSTGSFPLLAGTSSVLSVLSINCQEPVGPVEATTSTGEVVALRDDGVAPDMAAGDGVFTATLAPALDVDHVTLSSPSGTVTVPYIAVDSYLAEANVRFPYRQSLRATGGTEPYTWAVLAGSLPSGLHLDPGTGSLSGMPLSAGSSTFWVRATDALGRSTSEQLTLKVADDFVLETVSTADVGGFTVTPLSLAVDDAGNTIVAGYYSDPAAGREDFVTKKYDASGNVLWSRYRESGTPWWANWANAAGVDSAGAVYVAGGYPYFRSDSDFLVVKYHENGNELWSRRFDDGLVEVANALTIDGNGDLVVVGHRSTLDARSMEVLTLKCDAHGQLAWMQTHQVGLLDMGNAVATDQAGNIYVTGRSGRPYQVSGSFTSYTYSFLTVKYGPDGALLWSRADADQPFSFQGAQAIAVDEGSNSYVAGSFSPYIYKYDRDGALLWSLPFSVEGDPSPFVDDLELDGNGDLLVAGHRFDVGAFKWVYFLAKLDAAANVRWTKGVGGDYRDQAIDLSPDSNNDIHVSRPFGGGVLVSVYREVVHIETPSPLPPALRGYPYSQRLQAAGGLAPYTWDITAGALPPGLEIDAATGEIRGTPRAGGTYAFTVSATAPDQPAASADFTLSVAYVLIGTTALDFGMTGKSYSQSLTAQGTATPFVWKLVGGALPPGLRLKSGGAIIGSPTAAGTYGFSVQVTDGEAHSATADLQISIYDPLAIVTTSLPRATVGAPYSATVLERGGLAPYAWWVTKGALADGLLLDSGTGEVFGTPATEGKFTFTVTVDDGLGLTAKRELTIRVTR